MTKLRIFFTKSLIHAAALLPLCWLYYSALNDTLGADPVERVIHFTGIGALNILLLSLAISPLAKYKKWPVLLKFRRLLGLWAFTYSFFHLLNFVAFELQFDMELLIEEIISRPYITLGMLAFSLLFALAITSWSRIKKKMGKSWQQLHNWVYVGALLIAIHFYWSVKSEIIEPGLYILGVIILLHLRRDKIKRWLTR